MEAIELIFRNILNIVLIAVGALAIFFGFLRKGPMFRNPNVKEKNREIYNRRFSFFLIGSGLLMLIAVCLDFIRVPEWVRIASYLIIILWMVYFAVSTKKYMK